MASTPCWRCLVRPRNSHLFIRPSSAQHACLPVPNSVAATAPFSTSSALSASKNPQPAAGSSKGKSESFKLKKKKRVVETNKRAPEIGARKALRKKVVVSNANALQVPDLPQLNPELNVNEELLGGMLSLPDELVSNLKTLGAFGYRQSWGMFRQPSVLVRDYTLDLARMLGEPTEGKKRETVQQMVVGSKGSGKSVYLLQAMAFALTNNWVSIHIPEVRDLTTAVIDYSPIPGTKPTIYNQKTYISTLLQNIAAANPVLQTLQLQTSPKLPLPLQENMSLDRLAQLGSDPEISLQVFQALWAELTQPGRPPLLLSADNFNQACQPTAYLNPLLKPIHAQDLYVLNWFSQHLTGASPLPNGGAVLAAVSNANMDMDPALAVRLAQIEAHQSLRADTLVPKEDPALPFLLATGQEASPIPTADPFFKYDQRVLDLFGGEEAAIKGLDGKTRIGVKRVEPVSRDEARALMEYWARSGIVRAKVSEQFVTQKWTLSGGGVLGELERGCFGTRV